MSSVKIARFNPSKKLSPVAKLIFILMIIVVMGIAGAVSLIEGVTRFSMALTNDHATAELTTAVQQVRGHPTLDNMQSMGVELWGLSALSNVKHYADSKLMEQGLYYTTMPYTNKLLMLIHVVLASFCMLLGGFQFWPAFRKKYLSVHRKIGAIYIVTAPLSVLVAMLYLANTAPHHIYDHLVAWIALWIFGGLAIISIVMAVRAILAKRIYEHQAWMALSFGSLMVAPVLRWDWALLAWLFPQINQQTLNLVTMGMMLPQCLMMAYGLIAINRQFDRPMKQRKPPAFALTISQGFQTWVPVIYVIAVASIALSWFYFFNGGLSGFGFSAALVPHSLLLNERQALGAFGTGKWLLVAANGGALILTIYTLKALFQTTTSLATSASLLGKAGAGLAFFTGLISILLGYQIGLQPANVIFSGGTMYVVNGMVLMFFAAIYWIAQRKQQLALMKESMVFLACTLPFLSLYFITLWVMQYVHLPVDYVQAGQGFVIPVGFSMGLVFLAIFYVVYGQATREHN